MIVPKKTGAAAIVLFLVMTLVAMGFQLSLAQSGSTIYVKHDAAVAGAGTSWDDAYTDLQDALAAANAGDEIWVAAGIYYPFPVPGEGESPDRNATFSLKSGVALYGGFNGTETSIEDRDWEANITLLSGDLDRNDITDPYGVVTDPDNIVGDNAYHVVTADGTGAGTILDGFTITAGDASGPSWREIRGGGMEISGDETEITNIVFRGNRADSTGGGVYATVSEAVFRNVIFRDNHAHLGGGMYCIASRLIIEDALFTENSASSRGGGLANDHSSLTSTLTLTSVDFLKNYAVTSGGGMYIGKIDSIILTEVNFTENTTDESAGHPVSSGGGLDVRNSSSVVMERVNFTENKSYQGGGLRYFNSTGTFDNVTFTGNKANDGGGMYNNDSTGTFGDVHFVSNEADRGGGGLHNAGWGDNSLTFVNSSFRGNTANNYAGGIYNRQDDMVLINIVFSGNKATDGGGMYNDASSILLVNNTFSGNSGGLGSAIRNYNVANPVNDAISVLINCILWGNSGSPIFNPSNSITEISFSLVEGSGGSGDDWQASLGEDLGGNLDADPLFVEMPDWGDAPFTGGNYRLQHHSPAMNAGTNAPFEEGGVAEDVNVDLDGNPRIVDSVVNMGPYELYDPDLGTLQVTIEPEAARDAGAAWSVNNGITWYESGTAVTLPEGPYTVTYKELAGWDEPEPVQVEVNHDSLTAETGIYVMQPIITGTLTVTIEPEEARSAGAQWSVDGGDTWQDSGTELTLQEGAYTVTFKEISGWDEPASVLVHVTEDGEIEETGVYTPSTGTLTVTIEPEEARSAGAQWSVDGGDTWQDSGTELTLEVGQYTVIFSEIMDWDEPDTTPVEVTRDSQTARAGVYTRHTGTLTVTIEPEEARSAGAQWRVDGGGTWQDSGTELTLYTGTYELMFKDIGTLFAPPDATVTVFKGLPASYSGLYREKVIYVKQDATGANDGTSWSDAFDDLQPALDAAREGMEIWVAEGVYVPSQRLVEDNPRSATFQLRNGVSIYGGFAGGETILAERDWETNITVLSGDLEGNDITDEHGVVTDPANISGDNAFTIVCNDEIDATAILDGFVITAGKSDVVDHTIMGSDSGGGFYNLQSSPTLSNLIITGCYAPEDGLWQSGGGMMNVWNSHPTLTNVTFKSNHGRAMVNSSSHPTLTGVSFEDNIMGGMRNYQSSPTLSDVHFISNGDFWAETPGYGGGIHNGNDSSPLLTNVTFSGNYAWYQGGGLSNLGSSQPTLTNCIIWHNMAYVYIQDTSEVYNESGQYSSYPEFSYSIIKGSGGSSSWNADFGIDGGNNIDVDPRFVNQPQFRNSGHTGGNLRLQEVSPAIDAGINSPFMVGGDAYGVTTDLDGSLRIENAVVDMGPYECQVLEAVVSNTVELDSALQNPAISIIRFESSITADINTNRLVNLDFCAYMLNGSVRFYTFDAGSMFLEGSAVPAIAGDLTVYAPNATVTNNVKVGGEVIINNVAGSTWYENADGNHLVIHIQGEDASRVVINGNVNRLAVHGSGGELTVIVNGSVSSATFRAPTVVTGGDNIVSAHISAEGCEFDKSPQEYTNTVDVKMGDEVIPPQGAFRIAGSNRYTTAVEVSQAGWPGGAGTVVLARGDDYADALAGVPLAHHLDAPILLTRTDRLVGATKDEIERLNAQRVILLGGTGALSANVQQNLENLGLTVERIAGANRYDTAALIAKRLRSEGAVFDRAFIAVGTNFADALAASSYAAIRGEPVLLTPTTRLHAATEEAIDDLGILNTYVCGGEGAISSSVFDLLPNPVRIAGPNRYATAVELAEEFLPPTTRHVYVATGINFPDAIAGGVLAAKDNSGVILVRGDRGEPHDVVRDFLNDKEVASIALFGGQGAVSAEMEEWFASYLE